MSSTTGVRRTRRTWEDMCPTRTVAYPATNIMRTGNSIRMGNSTLVTRRPQLVMELPTTRIPQPPLLTHHLQIHTPPHQHPMRPLPLQRHIHLPRHRIRLLRHRTHRLLHLIRQARPLLRLRIRIMPLLRPGIMINQETGTAQVKTTPGIMVATIAISGRPRTGQWSIHKCTVILRTSHHICKTLLPETPAVHLSLLRI